MDADGPPQVSEATRAEFAKELADKLQRKVDLQGQREQWASKIEEAAIQEAAQRSGSKSKKKHKREKDKKAKKDKKSKKDKKLKSKSKDIDKDKRHRKKHKS